MKRWAIIGAVILLAIIVGLFFLPSFIENEKFEIKPATDFTVTDVDGMEFSLHNYRGNITILHFSGLENPLCTECLEEMKGQILELEKLANSDEKNVTIITINVRKNPYSDSGKVLAERDFGANVSWHWVEDFSPSYPIGNLYQDYWMIGGAFSNPSLVLIDINQSVVGVYHVYCMGKGKLDGIQTAESLKKDINNIIAGNWEGFKINSYGNELTFLGFFVLGILTALTPCSIALLVAMISYVGSLQKKTEESSKRYTIQGFWIGVIFTLGMAFVFFIFGLVLSYMGIFIEASTTVYLILGIILIILGINVFKPLKELIFRKSHSDNSSSIMRKGQNIFSNLSKKSTYLGAFFLGILFSIGWAPCAMTLMMPVFVITLTQKISILMGGLLLFIFGLGHGIPIIPLCTVASSVRGKLGNKYVSAGKWMQRIFGIIITVIGIIMAVRFWGINLW